MLTTLLLGLVVGLVLALTGAGGGILAVPLLVFGTSIGMAEAGPIGLMAVGMAAALGAILGLKAGSVRYRAALLIAGAGVLLSPPGMWIARQVDNRWLSVLFALTLLYVAARGLAQAAQPVPVVTAAKAVDCVRDTASGRFTWTRRCTRSLALSGALAGLLSGLLGVGGGFVMVPALQRYTDLTMESVVATSLAVIALVSIAGVTASAMSASLNWTIALPFGAGTLAGMLGGRSVSRRLAGPQLQIGFAAVSAVVALALIITAVF